jgi:D-3-phosphoglycerate dehydrogenase
MFKYICLNKIADIGLNLLKDNFQRVEDFDQANGVLVRSANLHEVELSPDLLAIARAGAGVNNIPLDKCADRGIVVFNTPGANANGVKELVIAALLVASRNMIEGINWVSSVKCDSDVAKLVEKNKAQFTGREIMGKKLGVIGLGKVGVLVANATNKLGMEVYGFDPFISVDAAWKLSKYIKHTTAIEQIFKDCDYITVHTPLSDATKSMFNKKAFNMMKDGVIILNFSRDSLVNDDDMIEALESGKVGRYITDFPVSKTALMKNVIAIPHLGASTKESEDNCAIMAANQIKDYLENGNIKNSVNYPSCSMGVCTQAGRIAICHHNIPNMLGQLTAALASENINISDMINKSKGDWAYTLIDLETPTTPQMIDKIEAIEGVLKTRAIK